MQYAVLLTAPAYCPSFRPSLPFAKYSLGRQVVKKVL